MKKKKNKQGMVEKIKKFIKQLETIDQMSFGKLSSAFLAAGCFFLIIAIILGCYVFGGN